MLRTLTSLLSQRERKKAPGTDTSLSLLYSPTEWSFIFVSGELMERESLEMDVVFVGAGPANLAGALHLSRLIAEHNEKNSGDSSLGEIQIAVIEKGSYVGAHTLSGAVMDPKGLAELIPDFKEKGAPLESEVKDDQFLISRRSARSSLRLIRRHSTIMVITSFR